jgi:hypothetical protein
MGELSERFTDLMARLAKTDADLFRTIAAQNASVRQLVEEIAPADPAAPSSSAVLPSSLAPPAPALAPAGLLPAEDCELKALKVRFGKVAEAKAWLEDRIGPAPKHPNWDVIAQTCRSGAWPATVRRGSAAAKGLTVPVLEERLNALEQRLELRFDQLERLLIGMLTPVDGSQGP